MKLLEDRAGLPVAEVTEILRQGGDYKQAAKYLSEGRTEEAFTELDRLGWIREVDDEHRYQQLADAYQSAVSERTKDGTHKSALVVTPTHAEAASITSAIRDSLKSSGTLKQERVMTSWVPTHLTDAQKADRTELLAGDLLQFHQNAKGYQKGDRLIVEDDASLPTVQANRFEVYRPVPIHIAAGDRLRVTAGGKTKDGKHRLSNGTLLSVQGFTKQGDIVVDHGWVIDKEFGHLTHGYAVTSHASQGATVNKVFVAISSQSVPATDQRTAYVAITRGKEQAVIFTDDRAELLKAMSRPDNSISATELAGQATKKPPHTIGMKKRLAIARGQGVFASLNDPSRTERNGTPAIAEIDHGR